MVTTVKKNKPVVFPRDHQAHDNIIEWWYFNGQLQDVSGRKYSYMDCLFKADAQKVKIPFLVKVPFKTIYFSHSIVSDLEKQKSYPTIEHVNLLSAESFTRPLLFANYTSPVFINGYTSSTMEETEPSVFRIRGERFDLKLTSKKKPMLEGGEGFVTVCGRDSYYYSLTNLETEGILNVNGKWIEVSGKSWMDHQWADVKYVKDRWSWFSIQLENNTELMCCEYGQKGNTTFLVDIIYPDGRHESVSDLILEPGKRTWRSKTTKAEYPLDWHIRIPSKKIELTTTAMIREQEMVFGAINYWEGPLSVEGVFNTKAVKGQGFMELVGYPSQYSNASLITKEITSIFNREFSKSRIRLQEKFRSLRK